MRGPPGPCNAEPLLFPSVHLGTGNKQHVFHFQSPHRRCLSSETTPVSRQNPEQRPDLAGAGWGKRCPTQVCGGELLRPRFHMLHRLQLPEDLEIKQPNWAWQWKRRSWFYFPLHPLARPRETMHCIDVLRGPRPPRNCLRLSPQHVYKVDGAESQIL